VAVTVLHVAASPEQVFAVLADARAYAEWVVGAEAVHRVDGPWPEPGATFHHTQGRRPLHLRDTTTVLEADPPRRLLLQVRARPAAVARVELVLRPVRDGTQVRMVETTVGGLLRLLPAVLREPGIDRRNRVSLGRLGELASRR
jgi:uncharacterized protein YndB with AHSA1/START domain